MLPARRFAEDEARLLISAARTSADLAHMVDRRVAGLALEHVLGWAEFCGCVETFARNGLIPRVASPDELNATVVIGTRPALKSGPGPG